MTPRICIFFRTELFPLVFERSHHFFGGLAGVCLGRTVPPSMRPSPWNGPSPDDLTPCVTPLHHRPIGGLMLASVDPTVVGPSPPTPLFPKGTLAPPKSGKQGPRKACAVINRTAHTTTSQATILNSHHNQCHQKCKNSPGSLPLVKKNNAL